MEQGMRVTVWIALTPEQKERLLTMLGTEADIEDFAALAVQDAVFKATRPSKLPTLPRHGKGD